MSKLKQIKKIWTTFIKVFSITFFVVAMLVLIVAVFLVISDNRRTAIFGFSFFIVVTDSMEPRLQVGEFIVVRATDPLDLEVDDMITFWHGDLLITHAIVEVQSNRVIARGDKAPAHQTETVYHDAIIGRVVAQSMSMGVAVMFLTSWQGLVLLIAVPLLTLLIYEAWRLKLKIKHKRESLQSPQESPEETPKNDENF